MIEVSMNYLQHSVENADAHGGKRFEMCNILEQ